MAAEGDAEAEAAEATADTQQQQQQQQADESNEAEAQAEAEPEAEAEAESGLEEPGIVADHGEASAEAAVASLLEARAVGWPPTGAAASSMVAVAPRLHTHPLLACPMARPVALSPAAESPSPPPNPTEACNAGAMGWITAAAAAVAALVDAAAALLAES